MSRLLKGILIGFGIGIGIALFIALMRSEEMRHQLRTRYDGLRKFLPESEQLKQSGQQVAERVSQTASKLKESAQQVVTKVRETGSTPGDIAQQSAGEVKQTGQDIVGTIDETTKSMQQGE